MLHYVNRPAAARAVPAITRGSKDRAAQTEPRSLISRATSAPVLTAALFIVTILAAGPLQGFDRALNKPWSYWILPHWRPFIDDVLDPIASQAVALPILAVTAAILAERLRSWRPLVAAAAAELAVVGLVGLMKLLLARPSPVLGNPSFFDGGLFGHDGYGIIFPSGHAAQAIALYGMVVYLLHRYGPLPAPLLPVLVCGVGLIGAMTVTTSLYLGWHWATDLLAGLLAGGLVLRIVTLADDAGPDRLRAIAGRTMVLLTGAPARRAVSPSAPVERDRADPEEPLPSRR